MAWTDLGANTGPAPMASSVPVVLATDQGEIQVDGSFADVLSEIRVALAGIASARGLIADLRVSVVNAPGVVINSGTVTTVSTVTSVTNVAASNLTNVGTGTAGTGLHAASTVVPNLSSIAYTGAFTANIDRGRGALYG